jgi:transposase
VAHARTAATRDVERARSVWLARQGERVPTIAAALHLSANTVRRWLKRFTADGLPGLTDESRSGRPATYTPEQGAEVRVTALTNPQELNLPFGRWPLDRLETYLHEQQGIPIKRSRIAEIFLAEGLRWRQQETWFGEWLAPAVAANRGALPRATPCRPRAAA